MKVHRDVADLRVKNRYQPLLDKQPLPQLFYDVG